MPIFIRRLEDFWLVVGFGCCRVEYGPQVAGELAGHGDDRLGVVDPTPGHAPIASAQTLLRAIGDRQDSRRLPHWFLALGASHLRDLRNRPIPQSRWSVVGGASVTWYLEDFLDLRLSASEEQSRVTVPVAAFPLDTRDRVFRISLAFDVFRGALDAPGLGVHERPLP